MATRRDPVLAFLSALQSDATHAPSSLEERAAATDAFAKKLVRAHGNKFVLTELGRYYIEEREGKTEGLTMIRALKPTRNRIKALQAEENTTSAERRSLEHVLEQMSELYTTDLYRQLAGISKELRTPIPELSAALAQYLNPNNLSGVKRDRVLKEMFGKT